MCPTGVYPRSFLYILRDVKHLVDIDDAALAAARRELGTETIKDTVNTALKRVARLDEVTIDRALDELAAVDFEDRDSAWR